jgi:hypothetical protein
MKRDGSNPLHQSETEVQGELQVFSGPALSPDDPSLEPRVRKGRPADQRKPAAPDQNERPVQE